MDIRVLARISESGVQKYTFGVNWVSNSFPSHCIIYTKNQGCVCVCVFVCHVYAGHLPIDGSASYFTQS